MFKNNKKNILSIILMCIPIYVSLFFSISNIIVNGYHFENYFQNPPYRSYYSKDYILLIKSFLFIVFSSISIIFLSFLVIKTLKINFKKIKNYEILSKDIYFKILLLFVLLNKILIIFSHCSLIKKFSQIFYLIGSFDYIIFYIVFGIINNFKIKNNFISYYFILFSLLILLQVFLGSIYDLALYTLVIIFFLLMEENNNIKKIINYSFIFFIFLILSFLTRDFLRSTSIIKSDKLICSKEKFLSSYSYAMKSFDNYNCNEINVSPYCKKFFNDKKFNYKTSNKISDFGTKNYNHFVVDKFTVNFLSRYDFLRELNNYVIFFNENNSYHLLGKTYENIFYKFIPRIIYPSKPNEQYGGNIPKKYGLMRFESSHSRPVNFFAESYINFSYYGSLISPLIFIIFLFPYFLFVKLFRGYNFLLIPILFCIFNFQNNLSLAIGHIYYLLFLIILFIFFLKIRKVNLG